MAISGQTSFPPCDLKLGDISGLVILYFWGLFGLEFIQGFCVPELGKFALLALHTGLEVLFAVCA